MVARTGIRISLLGFFVCALCPGLVAATTQTTVVLTLKPYNGQHEILELLPLVLTIELRNLGPGPAFLQYAGLTPDASLFGDPPHYRFEVRRPDGTSVSVYLADWVWLRSDPRHFDAPKPAEKQRIEYCLGIGFFERPRERSSKPFEWRAAVFSEPGQYEIRLAIPRAWPEGTVWSNKIRIGVISPTGTQDRIALRLLKDSRWLQILLTPFSGGITGSYPMSWYPRDERSTTSPIAVCRQILERCPQSVYAPYARSFLGSALASGWTETWRGQQKTNYTSQMEGLHLLQQTAKDPRLPLRFQEQALCTITRNSYPLTEHLSQEAASQLPPLEGVLGITQEQARSVDQYYLYRVAYKLAKGMALRGDELDHLAQRYSKEQIERLKEVALKNPHVPMVAGLTPEHAEIARISAWAESELPKIPWRNKSGDLNLKPIPISDP